MKQVQFAASDPFSLGVELEFQIVDRSTLDLVPRAEQICAHLPETSHSRFAFEFLQSIFEVQTGVCLNVDDVETDLRRTIKLAETAAEKCGSYLFSTGIHPFALPAAQKVTESERYLRIMDELQHVGRQFITQGLHVHVGMPNRETAIRVADAIQIYLPLLLALSTSSPFFSGEDTGFCSYRTKLFEALPLAGIADYLGNWERYEEEISMLQAAGIIQEIRDLWWDIRPSPHFGTVEIRICDMPSRFGDIIALTAVIQALAVFISEGALPGRRINPQLLQYNKWQACRHGFEGGFCDPFHLLSKNQQSVGWSTARMVELLSPVMQKMRTGKWVPQLHLILEQGTSSDRQRRLFRDHGSFRSMIAAIHEEFWI